MHSQTSRLINTEPRLGINASFEPEPPLAVADVHHLSDEVIKTLV
jgi:hypothetical protein